jgi:hypothetical protein
MTPGTKERMLWGWLRLFLGFAQISLVGLSVGALFSVGVKPITLIFVIAATALTVISRVIYKGRVGPNS